MKIFTSFYNILIFFSQKVKTTFLFINVPLRMSDILNFIDEKKISTATKDAQTEPIQTKDAETAMLRDEKEV